MKYPESIKEVERLIRLLKSELFETIEQAEARVQELKKEYQKYNRELPRKEIAKLLGVTPEHVSRLKTTGKLESYKMHDVHNYIKGKYG